MFVIQYKCKTYHLIGKQLINIRSVKPTYKTRKIVNPRKFVFTLFTQICIYATIVGNKQNICEFQLLNRSRARVNSSNPMTGTGALISSGCTIPGCTSSGSTYLGFTSSGFASPACTTPACTSPVFHQSRIYQSCVHLSRGVLVRVHQTWRCTSSAFCIPEEHLSRGSLV